MEVAAFKKDKAKAFKYQMSTGGGTKYAVYATTPTAKKRAKNMGWL